MPYQTNFDPRLPINTNFIPPKQNQEVSPTIIYVNPTLKQPKPLSPYKKNTWGNKYSISNLRNYLSNVKSVKLKILLALKEQPLTLKDITLILSEETLYMLAD